MLGHLRPRATVLGGPGPALGGLGHSRLAALLLLLLLRLLQHLLKQQELLKQLLLPTVSAAAPTLLLLATLLALLLRCRLLWRSSVAISTDAFAASHPRRRAVVGVEEGRVFEEADASPGL